MSKLFVLAERNPELVYALVSAALVLAVILITILIKSEADSPKRQTKRRVDHLVTGGLRGGRMEMDQTIGIRRSGTDSSFAVLDRAVKKLLPRPVLMRRRLAKTGFNLTIGEYVMACCVVGLFGAGVVYFFFKLGVLVAVVGGVAIGFGLPHVTTSFLINRRLYKFIDNFPEAIELIVRGLKSGLPVSESIRTVAQEIPKPVGVEFAQISSSVKLGQTLEQAMWETAGRIDIPEFKFFVVSMSIQKETGGNLAETLENLADLLRRRRQMKLKIRALSSEARASAYIIGALPFIMFGIIYLVSSQYVMQLFWDPRGNLLLGAGFVSLSLGVATMYKLVKFEI
ncbi:MAG: type II secretion system F family protein [Alphaproteobacteria bacterium]|nr:type II secretion system F family protein [Alphaproteobacteria bacterium]